MMALASRDARPCPLHKPTNSCDFYQRGRSYNAAVPRQFKQLVALKVQNSPPPPLAEPQAPLRQSPAVQLGHKTFDSMWESQNSGVRSPAQDMQLTCC